MISLIIPTYRNPKYLELCLQSAIDNRVNPNTEIVVIVDGFKEESQYVLDKFNQVKYIVFEENQGMQSALNAGVAQSTNPYVCIINDDNVMCTRWDERLEKEIQKAERLNERFMLTIDQVEPIGPGMFNFPVCDLGQTAETFRYDDWLGYEEDIATYTPFVFDGHIFPFVMKKIHYMAMGGFDTFYQSPNICDWDWALRLELMGFGFPRTRALRLYHFGSVSTKKNVESDSFRQREQYAIQQYEWKWGTSPVNHYNTNSKVPNDKQFRGFTA